MHKIDAEGFAPGNLFTEGDPQNAIPATVVSADWLNDVQGEIVTVITNMGIALVKGTITQLYSAIQLLIKRGGTPAPISVTIANNSVDQDIASLTFDKTKVLAKTFKFMIERKTATNLAHEMGEISVVRDTKNSVWKITTNSVFEDAGVTFGQSVVDANISQLTYTSDNMTGATYVGVMKVIQERETAI